MASPTAPKVAEATKAPPKPPSAPEMKDAWSRFEAGNNRAARRLAKGVLAGSASPDAKSEATDLLERIGYDPGAALSVLGTALVIVVILVLLVVTHKFD